LQQPFYLYPTPSPHHQKQKKTKQNDALFIVESKCKLLKSVFFLFIAAIVNYGNNSRSRGVVGEKLLKLFCFYLLWH
jgi:hypothetical protein